MSDPVTNVEIEDVLSSIRRLVSEDARFDPRPAPDADEAKPAKLVLTPAQRVSDAAQDDQASAPAPEITSVVDFDDAEAEAEQDAVEIIDISSDDSAPWDDPETTLYEAAQSAEASDDETDDAPEDALDALDAEADADADPLADWASDTPYAPDDEDVTADEALQLGEYVEDSHEDAGEAPQDVLSLDGFLATDAGDDDTEEVQNDLNEADEVEFVDAEEFELDGELDEDLEDELDGDDADAEEDAVYEDAVYEDAVYEDAENDDQDLIEEAVLDADEDTSLNTDELSQDPYDPTDEDQGHPEPIAEDPSHTERVAALSDKIKALEAAIGRSSGEWEPDGSEAHTAEAPQVETMRWQDHAPDSIPTGEPTEPAPETVDVLAADEAVLDEEMLRELVSDIVRQELQGALGERITRNVRKLVRREIHRALTVQEFE